MKTHTNNLKINNKFKSTFLVSSASITLTLISSCANKFSSTANDLAQDAIKQLVFEERFFSSGNLDIKLNSVEWNCSESDFLGETFNSCTFYINYQFGDKSLEFASVSTSELSLAGEATYFSTIAGLNSSRIESLESLNQLKEAGILISDYGSGRLSSSQIIEIEEKING
jgi:hypothetical protein